jgi:hypothetical protein
VRLVFSPHGFTQSETSKLTNRNDISRNFDRPFYNLISSHDKYSGFKTSYLTISRRRRSNYQPILQSRRRSEYRLVITKPEVTNCFSIISVLKKFYLLNTTNTRVYFMNVICINNLLIFSHFVCSEQYCYHTTIASEHRQSRRQGLETPNVLRVPSVMCLRDACAM